MIDAFLHVHCPQKQINKLKIYAVAGYVVILPDTAPEKVFPLQDLATLAKPQHGLEGKVKGKDLLVSKIFVPL